MPRERKREVASNAPSERESHLVLRHERGLTLCSGGLFPGGRGWAGSVPGPRDASLAGEVKGREGELWELGSGKTRRHCQGCPRGGGPKLERGHGL